MTTPPADLDLTLVVGLGSPDRGDDAVGPAIARRVAAMRLTGIEVVEREDPTSLIDLWGGRDLAVVVDAVCSGGVPGALVIMESGVGAAPLQQDAWTRTGRGGTHAFGLAAAVELARALNRLPRRLVLVGIEVGRLEHGAPLSEPVRGAVGPAVDSICGLLSEPGVPAGRPHPEFGRNEATSPAPFRK